MQIKGPNSAYLSVFGVNAPNFWIQNRRKSCEVFPPKSLIHRSSRWPEYRINTGILADGGGKKYLLRGVEFG